MMVTSKGQVTIPQHLREALGIHPGTEVEFTLVDGHLEVRRAEGGGRGLRVVDRLWGSAGPGPSTDEIMALTRAEE